MPSRTPLLHPATLIATGALFVALGGVTYAATTIGTSQIKNGAVTNPKLASSAVSAAKLASGSVITAKLANNSVTAGKIASGAVTGAKLANGAVTAAKLAANAVGAAQIATGAVTTAKLANGAVTAGQIAGGAVGTTQLANEGVTAAKLANAAVGTTQLADLSVTGEKLAGGSVTGGKIAAATITAGNLAPGTAVTGKGQFVSGRVNINAGASAAVLALPGLGAMSVTCQLTGPTLAFGNQSGQTLQMVWDGNGAAPVFGSNAALANAGEQTVATTGPAQSLTVQLAPADPAGTAPSATVWLSMVNGTTCNVTAQALLT